MSNQTKQSPTRSIGVRLPLRVAEVVEKVVSEEFGGGTSEYVRDLVRADLRRRKLMPSADSHEVSESLAAAHSGSEGSRA